MSVAAPAEEPAGARSRILDAALALMSEHGVAGASMRQLAAASGLNVATIYHYFPSKADVVRAVLDERRYGERLLTDQPPTDPTAAPSERLAALVRWLWEATCEEEATWRLLLGEALRGEPAAADAAGGLVAAVDAACEAWLATVVPELAVPPAVAGRALRVHLFSLVVEHVAGGVDEERVQRSTADLVALLLAVGPSRA